MDFLASSCPPRELASHPQRPHVLSNRRKYRLFFFRSLMSKRITINDNPPTSTLNKILDGIFVSVSLARSTKRRYVRCINAFNVLFFILLPSVRLNIYICRDTYNRIRSNANKVEGRGRNKNFYVAVVTNGLAVSISISDLSRCSVYNYS